MMKKGNYILFSGLMATLIFYNWPILSMNGIALGGDGSTLFYPAEHMLAQALKSGTLPFWTTNIQSGFPLLADGQPGALYPLNLLAFGLLPTPAAHNFLIFLHSLIGLGLMFLWGKTLKFSTTAAGVSAIIFVLTSPLMAANMPMLETFAWTPALFIFAEYIAQKRRSGWLWAMPLVISLQLLAGFPQIAFYAVVSSSFYLIFRIVTADQRKQSHYIFYALLLWGGLGVAGVILSAPQLLPTYELSQFSIRAGGIRGSMAGERSLFPAALATYLLPTLRSFTGRAGLGVGAYLGMLPLLLATLSWISPDRPAWKRPLLAMMLMALLLAFGRFTPLFWLTRRIPFFSSFRVPSRFIYFTQFGLATFAGHGWMMLNASLALGPVEKRIKKGLLFGLLFLLSALLFSVTIIHGVLVALQPSLTGYLLRLAERITNDAYHLQNAHYYEIKVASLYQLILDATSWRNHVIILLVVVLATAFLCWRQCGYHKNRFVWFRIIWGMLIVIDLLAVAGWHRRVDAMEIVTSPPPVLKIIDKDDKGDLSRMAWVVDAESVTSTPSALAMLVSNYNAIFGIDSIGLYSPLGFKDYYQLQKEIGNVNLAFGLRPVKAEALDNWRHVLNLLNVRHILSRTPMPSFEYIGKDNDVFIYRNDSAMPRAFAVDDVVIEPDAQKAIEWIKNHPQAIRAQATIPRLPPHALTPGAATQTHISFSQYETMQVTIHIITSGHVLLILTDTFYPGWQAYLDGGERTIYRADGVFRAVAVPPGEHTVTFVYHPMMFWRGLAIAAVGVIFLILLILFAIKFGKFSEISARSS